ncbi:FMN reductase [Bacillus sp. TS-2]|nr:FMN reductase [Bacillus sp. TS-2]
MSYQITLVEVPTNEPSLKCIEKALKVQLDKFGELISNVTLDCFYEKDSKEQAFQAVKEANLIILLFEAKENPYKQMIHFLQTFEHTFFKGKMLLPVIMGGTQVHASIIEISLKPILNQIVSTELIPTMYVMEKGEKKSYRCERKDSDQEINEYLFSLLKKYIPLTFYI